MTYDQATEVVMNGSFFSGTKELYTVALGDFFFPLLYAGIVYAVYVKTDSEGATAIIGLLGAGILVRYDLLSVEYHWFFYLVVSLTLAALLMRSYFGRME